MAGTAGNDVLRGTDGPDVIAGAGGDDVIYGRGGDYIICAGAGNDRVFAGPGDNLVFGGSGIDKLRAGGGDDIISGGSERDFIKGGHGNDRLAGQDGPDRIRGSVGDDVLFGDADIDVLWGGPGDDVIDAGAGADLVKGSAGIDICRGGPGADDFDDSCETIEPGTVRVVFIGSFSQLGSGSDAGPASVCASGRGCFGTPLLNSADDGVSWADIEALVGGETVEEPWGRWRSGTYRIEADYADDGTATLRSVTETEDPYRHDFATPCPAPAGGWPWPPLRQGDRDNRVLVDHQQQHPNDFGSRIWDGWLGVSTIQVARNLEQHRVALTALTDTPLCFDPVAYSTTELNQARDRLRPYLGRWGDAYGYFGSGIGLRNRVSYDVTQIDAEFWRDVGDLAPKVHTNHAVEVLDATVADLPQPLLQPPPAADDFYVACGGRPIDPAIFDEPADDHLDGSPSTAIFDHPSYWPGIDDAASESGWWRVYDAPGTALYVSDGPTSNLVGAELRSDGLWEWSGSSSGGPSATPCAMTRQAIGFTAARWGLDPDRLPRPGQRRISTLVTERDCTGATLPGDRLLDPIVEETSESVTITFALRPQPAGFYTCPGNPSTPVLVQLAQPLGDRVLLDGQTFPGTEAEIGTGFARPSKAAVCPADEFVERVEGDACHIS